MNLYAILVSHYGPKTSHKAIQTYVVASSDEAVHDWLRSDPTVNGIAINTFWEDQEDDWEDKEEEEKGGKVSRRECYVLEVNILMKTTPLRICFTELLITDGNWLLTQNQIWRLIS